MDIKDNKYVGRQTDGRQTRLSGRRGQRKTNIGNEILTRNRTQRRIIAKPEGRYTRPNLFKF